jgi:PilZ domain-containing protein
LYLPPRQRTRNVPHRPITVRIDDETRLPVGYGVVPNVSEAGACVWTNSQLKPGARLVLQISFGHPAELHEIAARVVWSGEDEDPLGGLSMRRYGLQWQDLSSACVLRLRYIVGEASTRSAPAPTSR